MAYAVPPEWTFESTITGPDGIRIATTISVPVDAEWNDVRECSELSQMGANFTSNHVRKSIATSADKEPPF
jgi:hypothetical protein